MVRDDSGGVCGSSGPASHGHGGEEEEPSVVSELGYDGLYRRVDDSGCRQVRDHAQGPDSRSRSQNSRSSSLVPFDDSRQRKGHCSQFGGNFNGSVFAFLPYNLVIVDFDRLLCVSLCLSQHIKAIITAEEVSYFSVSD